MLLHAAALSLLLAGAVTEKPAVIVRAPDSPVKLDQAAVVTAAAGPPVLIYAATNETAAEVDQFTVMVFVFDQQGTLKTRQVAPGRRTLNPKETKYSSMVLDGGPMDPADHVVVGVNQSQNAGSETWWRADLQAAAEAAKPSPKQ